MRQQDLLMDFLERFALYQMIIRWVNLSKAPVDIFALYLTITKRYGYVKNETVHHKIPPRWFHLSFPVIRFCPSVGCWNLLVYRMKGGSCFVK